MLLRPEYPSPWGEQHDDLPLGAGNPHLLGLPLEVCKSQIQCLENQSTRNFSIIDVQYFLVLDYSPQLHLEDIEVEEMVELKKLKLQQEQLFK